MTLVPKQIVFKLSPKRDRFIRLNDAELSRNDSIREIGSIIDVGIPRNVSVCKEMQCDSQIETGRHTDAGSEFQLKVRNLSRILRTDKKTILLTAYTILDELQDIQMPLGQCSELFAQLRTELTTINDILQRSNLSPSNGLIAQMAEIHRLLEENELAIG